MTKSPQESIIAILIARLGGDVRITPKEFYDADNLELTRIEDPSSMDMRFTSKLPPVELVGELVEDEPPAIAGGAL